MVSIASASKDPIEVARVREQFAEFDYMFKIILVGDTGVGKTCLIKRIDQDKFEETHTVTLGGDFAKIFYVINQKKVKVQLWDTCGLEQYRSMIKIYFKGADASIIVFDLSDEKSFYAVQRWIADIRENTSAAAGVYLVGNKCDLMKRVVPKEAVDSYVASAGIKKYFEVSAKTSFGIDPMIRSILQDTFAKKTLEEKSRTEEEAHSPTAKVLEPKKKAKKGGCC